MPYIGTPPLTKAERNVIDHNVIDGQDTYQLSYTPGFLDVILNGVTLQSSEYTATSGIDIILNTPTITGDTLTTVAWGTFETASVSPNSIAAQHLQDGIITSPKLDVRELQVAGLLPTAWCVFDGTLAGTNPPIAGYNIVNITRNSTGSYTVNFENPMDITDYLVVPNSVKDSGQVGGRIIPYNQDSRTVNSFSINVMTPADSVARDNNGVGLQVFGGLV